MLTGGDWTMTKHEEILSIAINHGVNAEHLLYRLKRGSVLHIVPGTSLIGRRVALYCNLPVNGKLILFNFCLFINMFFNDR